MQIPNLSSLSPTDREAGRQVTVGLTKVARRACIVAILSGLFPLLTCPSVCGQDFPLNDPFGAPGVAGEAAGIPAEFSAEFELVEGTREGKVTLTVNTDPGHYVYSLTQVGGPGPSTITLADNDQVALTGEFKAEIDPDVTENDPVFKTRIEKHMQQAIFSAPIKLTGVENPESFEFELIFDGQVCSQNNCIPVDGERVTASFAGYRAAPSKAGEYRPEGSHVTWKGYVEPRVAAPGDTVRLVLTAVPESSYYIYGFRTELPPEADTAGLSPTFIALTKRNNWPTKLPQPSVEPAREEVIDGVMARKHKEPVSWSIEIEVPRGADLREYELGGFLAFQTCFENGCDLPGSAEFSVPLTVAAETELGQVPVQFAETSRPYDEVAELAAKVTWGNGSAGGFGDKPVAVILGFAFLAGLILNIMPCVLPVIGLKIMSFVDQAGSKRLNIIKLNLWFSAGLIFVFLILATMAAVFGLGWGEHFQSVTFTVALISIVFTFALSFLGVWEVPIPGFVGSSTTQKMASKEGAMGAFSKGILTTILATPCTGPFLVPTITWSLTQPAWLTYTLFATVGLGMASPYLLIGAFPSLINLLPRPGAWMETFKQLMGFVLMGTVVWLFSSLDNDLVVPTLTLLVGIAVACWWIGRTPSTADTKTRITNWGLASAWSVAIAAFAFLYLGGGVELEWEPFDRVALEEHVDEGKTVLVDFTADWCGTCKTNEALALNTSKTKRYLEDHGIVAMKADKTRKSPDIDELLVELGNPTKGIPYLAIYPADGSQPIIHEGMLTQAKVLELLEEAGPSQAAPEAETSENSQELAQNK